MPTTKFPRKDYRPPRLAKTDPLDEKRKRYMLGNMYPTNIRVASLDAMELVASKQITEQQAMDWLGRQLSANGIPIPDWVKPSEDSETVDYHWDLVWEAIKGKKDGFWFEYWRKKNEGR